MDDDVVPLLVEGKEKTNLTTAMSGKRKTKGTTASNPKKRKKLEKCKWCGATSHKTKRSNKCPFHGSTLTSPPTATAQPAPIVDNGSPESSAATAQPFFNIGDTVLAMWSRRKWFLAHVTAVNMGKYDLYFPECGSVKLGWDPKKVKACPGVRDGLPIPRRGDMIIKVFYDDGIGKTDRDRIPDGMWLVRTIIGNEYLCVRSPDCRNKDASPNSMNFDIGYVMRTIEKAQQTIRNEF